MDASKHTLIVGASTVAGAYFQSKAGFPFITSFVKGYIGNALGGFADVAIGAAGFWLSGKYVKYDGVGDVLQGAFLGYGLSALLSMVGL